jgi:RHS repeat-associated protein
LVYRRCSGIPSFSADQAGYRAGKQDRAQPIEGWHFFPFAETGIRKLTMGIIACLFFMTFLSSLIWDASGNETFTYDANGNMISDSSFNYIYNDANQLAKITSKSDGKTIAEYYYDSGGKRVKKIENGKTVYYINDYVESKTGDGADKTTSYYFANNERVARKDPDGVKYYYHGDQLGSTNIVTNDAKKLSEKIEYYPYGSIKERIGKASSYLYAGQELDVESGLYYYGARYYNPVFARFIQPDDIIPNQFNPQSLNRYAYCIDNPVKYTDPSGNMYVPGLSELGKFADEFSEKYIPALAAHNQKMRDMVQTNPEALWNAGRVDLGPAHFKPGAIAEKMYNDPLGFFCIIGEGAIDAFSAGAGSTAKSALKAAEIGFGSGMSKEFLQQTDAGKYDATQIVLKGSYQALESGALKTIGNQMREKSGLELWDTKSGPALREVTRWPAGTSIGDTSMGGRFITWSPTNKLLDQSVYFTQEYGLKILAKAYHFSKEELKL